MNRSSKSATRVLAALLPLLIGAMAAHRQAATLELQPESKLWVGGTSSMRGWECKATTFAMNVESTQPGAAAAVLGGDKAVTSVQLTVPAEQLECGNGTMNGHMRKAIKAQEHPQVAFRMETYELTRVSDSLIVNLKGALTLGGTQKPIEMRALAVTAPNGGLRVTGSYALKMTEYGLKPPTLMFGTMKVGDLVKVGFDVVLRDPAP